MADRSAIEWTDATWNAVRGCSRVSEGCRHCYAEEIAARFSGPGLAYEGLAKRVGGEARWTGKVRFLPEKLDWPLRWRGAAEARAEGRPSPIFVNSMSDLFHEEIAFEQIAAVFGVMAAAPQHTFQVLTKRPERAMEFFAWIERESSRGGMVEAVLHANAAPLVDSFGVEDGSGMNGADRAWLRMLEAGDNWPLRNVWLGVSVEDQATADERIPLLLQCPAAVRFVSYEPALGPVDFTGWLGQSTWRCPRCGRGTDEPAWVGFCNPASPAVCPTCPEPWPELDPAIGETAIAWMIVGGESGRRARPFDVAWACSTVEQCREAGVACFVKQVGRWVLGDHSDFGTVERWLMEDGGVYVPPLIGPLAFQRPTNAVGFSLADSHGGDPGEWPADLRVRQLPATATPEARQLA